MPEGDTIYRAARTLHQALAGRTVTRFESVFPTLTRVDQDQPLHGRTIDGCRAVGKHLVMSFSGGLVLRTHMRMHGSWHIYRPGERWQRPRHEMRIIVSTADFEAVAFSVPEAEFLSGRDVDRQRDLRELGPDVLAGDFDAAEAARRMRALPQTEIADVLLDQRALAGIGNIYKSEILFLTGVNPFSRIADLDAEAVDRLIATAVRLLRANVGEATGSGIVTYGGLRRTTGRSDPSARLWVYGRGGEPCRRCGTAIQRRTQGPHARSPYWCERCQPR